MALMIYRTKTRPVLAPSTVSGMCEWVLIFQCVRGPHPRTRGFRARGRALQPGRRRSPGAEGTGDLYGPRRVPAASGIGGRGNHTPFQLPMASGCPPGRRLVDAHCADAGERAEPEDLNVGREVARLDGLGVE